MMIKVSYYKSTGNVIIGHCCDVEGDLEYWESYIRVSKVLIRDANAGKLVLKDNCHFVYGGDVCDRGNGDIRILTDLIQV